MLKRFSLVILPLLIGIILGFYIRDFRGRADPEAQNNDGLSQKFGEITPIQHLTKQEDRIAETKTGEASNQSRHSLDELSVAEIQTALEHIRDIADLNQRSSLRNVLLKRWAELDGAGAFGYVNALDEGEIKVQAMTEVTGVLVRAIPGLLAEKALALPGNRSSRELIQNLANSWGQTDAHAAFLWAEQLPEGVGKKDALAIIRFQMGQQDPEELSTQIDQLPPGDSRNSLITSLAEQWGARDPAKAMEWINSVLSESEKKLAMSNLAGAWARRDPLAAGAFVAQMPPGEAQSQAAMSVVSSWAGQSPDQTAAWVLQFPEGDLREQGIREVVSIWTMNDSKGAQKWAGGLAAGATRDMALKIFAESIAYWSPDKAAAVVGLIDDPQKREQSMEVTMRFWAEIDPKSARNWLAHLDVSEESKVRLGALLSAN